MAIDSSIFAQKIPWTEEPGGLYGLRGCKESDMTEQLALSLHFHKRVKQNQSYFTEPEFSFHRINLNY